MIATVPRPALLALVGVVLVGGLFVVTRRGADSTEAVPVQAPTAPPESPAAEKPPTTAPQGKPQSNATPGADKGEAGGRGLPSRVARALEAKKTVVILFWNKAGIEDRSVKGSVQRLPRRNGKTAVFTDKVSNISHYTRITASANVNQTPALVIVNPKGRAEVLNGYYDYQTIRQFVGNAGRR